MGNSASPTPKKKFLDDSQKLAIHEEIEKEVEKRIQRQEGFYWKFLALFGASAAAFAYALWHVQLSELPGVVQKELATQAVTQAKDRIIEIKSSAEAVNQNLNATAATVSNILVSVDANQQTFTNRLNEIKQRDNVATIDDLYKLFVQQTQIVTNLSLRKIPLDYEPIPQTVSVAILYLNGNRSQPIVLPYQDFGYLAGNIVTLTNTTLNFSGGDVKFLEIKYVKKSLR